MQADSLVDGPSRDAPSPMIARVDQEDHAGLESVSFSFGSCDYASTYLPILLFGVPESLDRALKPNVLQPTTRFPKTTGVVIIAREPDIGRGRNVALAKPRSHDVSQLVSYYRREEELKVPEALGVSWVLIRDPTGVDHT